jgi:uncharacterized membrane protein YgdD (TMEM256/DUF423 family)
MSKRFIQIAAILGALSVAFGAFGAHALKKMIDADSLATFETAVRYQFYHTFALLGTGILYRRMPGKIMEWAGILFISGIVLFCGSLYILAYLSAIQNVGLTGVGAITPLGGVCFIAGWVCICIQAMKPTTHHSRKGSSAD